MLEVKAERCAGIDVGKKFLAVCVMIGPANQKPVGLLSTKLCLAAESQSTFKASLEHRVQLRQYVSDAVGRDSPFAIL